MGKNPSQRAKMRTIYAKSQGFKNWGAYLAHKIAQAKLKPQPPQWRKPWEIVGWTRDEYYDWLESLSNATEGK